MILIFYNSLFCTSTQIPLHQKNQIPRIHSHESSIVPLSTLLSKNFLITKHRGSSTVSRSADSLLPADIVAARHHSPPWKIRIPGLENKDEVISDTVSTKHETRDEGEHEEPNWNDDDEGDQPRRMAEPRWRCTSSQDNDVSHEDHCYRRGLASRTKDISG